MGAAVLYHIERKNKDSFIFVIILLHSLGDFLISMFSENLLKYGCFNVYVIVKPLLKDNSNDNK